MPAIEANIQSCFSTPLVTVSLPEPEPLNSELEALFEARAAQGDTYRHEYRIPTQVGDLFESTFDLFAWTDPPVQALTAHCHTTLRRVVQQLNEYDDATMAGFTFQYESWFHISRTGAYQSIHLHPKHTWSGIYCVRAGDPVPGRPESGAVKFYDPRGPAFMYWDAGNERLREGFANTPIYLHHADGQMVLFPSFIQHEVLPYLGTRDRIIVAFNAKVLREGE